METERKFSDKIEAEIHYFRSNERLNTYNCNIHKKIAIRLHEYSLQNQRVAKKYIEIFDAF